MPLDFVESRFDVPLEAQDASYLAASDRIASFCIRVGLLMLFI